MTISDCAFAMCNVHNAITHITGGGYTCYGVISGVRVGFFRDAETTGTQRKMIPDFVVVSLVSRLSPHSYLLSPISYLLSPLITP